MTCNIKSCFLSNQTVNIKHLIYVNIIYCDTFFTYCMIMFFNNSIKSVWLIWY